MALREKAVRCKRFKQLINIPTRRLGMMQVPEPQHQVQGGVLLDAVLSKRAPIVQMPSAVDQPMARGNALLHLSKDQNVRSCLSVIISNQLAALWLLRANCNSSALSTPAAYD